MRAVVQRVTKSSVTVEEKPVGEIEKGLVILLGVGENDSEKDVKYLADKILNLRIFEDEDEKMNLPVLDCDGDILVVSQFTLYGDCRKGRRPGYSKAASPAKAKKMYEEFVSYCRDTYNIAVRTGIFQAKMMVEIFNDGPVTLMLDSKKEF